MLTFGEVSSSAGFLPLFTSNTVIDSTAHNSFDPEFITNQFSARFKTTIGRES